MEAFDLASDKSRKIDGGSFREVKIVGPPDEWPRVIIGYFQGGNLQKISDRPGDDELIDGLYREETTRYYFESGKLFFVQRCVAYRSSEERKENNESYYVENDRLMKSTAGETADGLVAEAYALKKKLESIPNVPDKPAEIPPDPPEKGENITILKRIWNVVRASLGACLVVCALVITLIMPIVITMIAPAWFRSLFFP